MTLKSKYEKTKSGIHYTTFSKKPMNRLLGVGEMEQQFRAVEQKA
jgi:hypothetical protein